MLHKRISRFFKLYSQILNFQTYMLVSHRNMVSVFDMSQGTKHEAKWVDTLELESGYVRQMFIKKRSKAAREHSQSAFKTFEIVILAGPGIIVSCELTNQGKFDLSKDETGQFLTFIQMQAPGRIIRFMNDDQYN